jgi:hypothetical protein
MNNLKCAVFVKEKSMPDFKNLLLPVETTLFVDGLNQFERMQCHKAANDFNIVNLLEEHGIVLVMQQGSVRVKIAGSDAIEQYIEEFHKNKSEVNLETF